MKNDNDTSIDKPRIIRTIILTAILFSFSNVFAELPQWDFDQDSDLRKWEPNAHLTNVVIEGGRLKAQAIDGDPFFYCRDIAFQAGPGQYVVIRMKADRPGIGELFWSGELEGRYSGLTEKKKIRFSIDGENDWQDIVLFPFWHTERTIRQLRLDVFNGSRFEIDWIRIMAWGDNRSPSRIHIWGLGGDISEWRIHPEASELFAPPIRIDVGDKNWVTVELKSGEEGIASILWACEKRHGLQSKQFRVRGDDQIHSYNIHMDDMPVWRDTIVAFGIRLPKSDNVQLKSIRLGDEPSGPGELEVNYFGFENGVNRAGRPCRLLAQIVNRGGSVQGIRGVHFYSTKGLNIISEPDRLLHEGLEHGERAEFVWEVLVEEAGSFEAHLSFKGKGFLPPRQSIQLKFSEAPHISDVNYIPEPKPVETDIDICGFYFPGWNSQEKWDCIHHTAPNRKPLLGYYDESNPECVDWQIKWAVENGISCFLVDWYWVQGRQHLTHWFEAYRKAKYRDFLKVAIMWANHNPPNTHSVEDWLRVTRHWIEHYFSMKSYYHINGKPAVFIWNPKGIRSDLGGSKIVRDAFHQSQELACAAGYRGITFVAMGYDFSVSHIRALHEEGYHNVTTYHEWGDRIDGGVSQKYFNFETVVQDSPAAWTKKEISSQTLEYYPLVDTGWDSRPWHGDKSMVIRGRTPALFERLLREAQSFCEVYDKPILILGPLNEWGEGSYIEPCTDFGFEMLEAIHNVFAKGNPASWPENISPSDVGLGPYDFP